MVRQEAESGGLRQFLHGCGQLVSSVLLRVEALRALARQSQQAAFDGRHLLRDVALIELNRELLDRAITLSPIAVRSLNALHAASAMELEEDLDVLVTYDNRTLEAAQQNGLDAHAPC
jgi:uncharacterized protein